MGMIILACFWLTNGSDRSAAYVSSDTFAAIEACFNTLSKFARRWPQTSIYRDVFELVASATPFVHLSHSRVHEFPAQHVDTLMQYRNQLLERQTPRVIVGFLDKVLGSQMG
jgi:hypothetical protein